jgi:V/A-type H+-transporting ATPase subunit E
MKTLENGHNKIQIISDKLRHEIIEPSKVEAQQIIESAHLNAAEIVSQAEKQAEGIKASSHAKIEQDRKVFQSSMWQALQQCLESLRQNIEQKLFNEQLNGLIENQMSDPQIVANLINAIVQAIEKEGLGADLSAVIPRTVSSQAVSKLLLQEVLNKLKGKSIAIGNFAGGAEVKIEENKIRIVFTDATLKEMLSNYIRKDFRALIFAQEDILQPAIKLDLGFAEAPVVKRS